MLAVRRLPSSNHDPSIVGSPWGQRLTYGIGSLLLNGFVDLRVEGREQCPKQGAFVLAANHHSHFDPPLLTKAAGRWIDWVAMVELYRHRWLARYCTAMAAIPVDRSRLDRQAAVSVLRRLQTGRAIGIFPEGGIRRDERSVLRSGPLDPGACRLALAARVPVVPVVVLNSESMYSPGGWLFPRRAFHVVVRFGCPLMPQEGQRTDKTAADILNDQLAGALRDLAAGSAKG